MNINYNFIPSMCHACACTGMPENITFDPTTSRTMTLSWDPPVADSRDIDGIILSYNILCSSDDHMDFSLQQMNIASAQSVSMTSLNPFTNYNCCIATLTSNGNGPYHCDSGITLEDGKCLFIGKPHTNILIFRVCCLPLKLTSFSAA